jgi:hypothetical protein
VTWTWTITASGTTKLYDLVVSDRGGASVNCDVDGDGIPDGTSINPGPLDPGQTYTCSATGTVQEAALGTYQAVGQVRAVDFAGSGVFTDQDPSHHTPVAPFVADPGVAIRTLVNGQDAGSSTGPFVAEGSPVTWSYVVTNTGNVPLNGVEVRDGAGLAIDCGAGSPTLAGPLAPGASITCRASTAAARAGAGPQSRSGSVLADALDPTTGAAIVQVNADDPATYVPVELPGRLAFTGPSDDVISAGVAALALGAGLTALARIRRRPATVPTRSETDLVG